MEVEKRDSQQQRCPKRCSLSKKVTRRSDQLKTIYTIAYRMGSELEELEAICSQENYDIVIIKKSVEVYLTPLECHNEWLQTFQNEEERKEKWWPCMSENVLIVPRLMIVTTGFSVYE